MTKNNLASLLKSRSPLDYPILTPLVSFISLCASFEAGLIHSFIGNFNLNRHRSSEHHEIQFLTHSEKRWNTGKSDTITCQCICEFNPARSLYWQYRFEDQEILGDPYLACPKISSRKSYLNLYPSQKKASMLIASLSVLSIKFHYIQLIHRGSWFLI